MKVVIAIDNVQYAWVSLLTPTSSLVALYKLSTKSYIKHIKALHVELIDSNPSP